MNFRMAPLFHMIYGISDHWTGRSMKHAIFSVLKQRKEKLNAVSSEKGTPRILKICVVLSHRITFINVWHAFSRKEAYTFRFVATQK